MWIEFREIEFAGEQEDHGADGAQSAVTTRLAPGGLKQAIQGLQEAVGLTGLCPSDDALEVPADQLATSFIGSTFERMTLVHHCLSMADTTLICLRSRISRSYSRYTQARAVRWVVTRASRASISARPSVPRAR